MVLPPVLGVRLQLLVDGDGAYGEVNAVPGEAKDLSFAHPGEQGDKVDSLEGVVLCGLEKANRVVPVQRLDFLLLDAGKATAIHGIGTNVPELDRLLERPVEHQMDVSQGLGRKPLAALVNGFDEVVVELLDSEGGKLLQLDSSKGGLDVLPDVVAVVHGGTRLHIDQVGVLPDVQPLSQGHLARLPVSLLYQAEILEILLPHLWLFQLMIEYINLLFVISESFSYH